MLVVDDRADVRSTVADVLRLEGFDVSEAATASAARAHLERARPDVVLLDVVMPDGDGLELLGLIRSRYGVPVILLTARGEEHERVEGLDLGADDYVVKPFPPRELAARVRSVVRRHRPAGLLRHGGLVIDRDARTVTVDGRPVELTAKEFDLLATLAGTPGRSWSRAELLRAVWRSSPEWQSESTVTEHVRRLRQKLDRAGTAGITTVRGAGYRFDTAP